MPDKKFEEATGNAEKYDLMIREFVSFIADVEESAPFSEDEKAALARLGLFVHGISDHVINGLEDLQRKEE